MLISLKTYAQKSDFKHINFANADSIANSYKNENLKSLPKLALLLTKNLDTDAEKFRAIYMWVSKNIKGDHAAVSKNTRKRTRFKNDSIKLNLWNKSFNKILFKKLLKNKKTVCTGYAYLIRELCTLTNIEAKIIDGYGRSAEVNIGELSIPNHSWNAIKLNTKWYLADATWSSGYTDLNRNTFILDYNDGYFLTEPQLFLKSHYPLVEKWKLLQDDVSSTLNFVNAPLVYGETFKLQIITIYPIEMKNNISKDEEFFFQLQENNELDLSQIDIQIENFPYTKPISIKRTNKKIHIKYKFKFKGFYDVHLLYKKQVIATYTFKVGH